LGGRLSLNHTLIYPLFAMFVLTTFVLLWMFFTRYQALKTGAIRMKYFKLYGDEPVPEAMLQASRHFSNLFEVPVLFYVVSILGILFSEGLPFTILAWVYVLARVIHAWIHLTSNRVMTRMYAYAMGWLALLAMWFLLMFHQIFAPAA
jgi:hypothetical protein